MKKNIKNKIIGILVMLVGAALLLLGGWLFTKVWGTALLYTDAALGKAAAYYWVALIAAVIALVSGIFIFRKKVSVEAATDEPETKTAKTPKQVVIEKADKPETKTAKTPKQVVEENADEPEKNGCPNCGASIQAEMKFCMKCGHKLS